ncbi:cadherin-like domain-containing protein [Shewanella sp. AS16]|uniref:cadherin-like domain-containing protein n=1 Tax=Shewanella sp. AS16 TaxID=2907625 RepID=UPI001F2ED639|nr:cadherin-like domain-containing protein [Shewanella sp. AS16]MCE9687928.1 cadherin-like domain-containing protein [Shewanella sp. AS16]
MISKQSIISKTLLATLISTALAGCGGGEDKAVENKVPTVSVSDISAVEMTSASLTATASDADGSIASYAWTQKSGIAVALTGADSATASFTAPAVAADTALVFSVTVTDNQGASVSKDVTVTVTANMVSFSLQGKVTDAPIANARVVVSVGGQDFSAVADVNGDYSAEVSVDDSFATSLVKITAMGPAEDSQVKLVSLLGSVNAVVEQAGADGVATKDELFGVNVTNVTTAVDALMQAANQGEEIATQEAFDSAVQAYDTSLLLPLATAIKLVIDYAGANPDLALPEGVADTQALVAQLETVQTYLQQAQQTAAETYSEAQAAIVADEEVIASGTGSAELPIADTYYFTSTEGMQSGDRLVLTADGKGTLYSWDTSISLTWSTNDAGILLSYAGEGLVSVEGKFIDGKYFDVERHRTQTQIKWLARGEKADQLLLQHTSYIHYPNAEYPDSEPGLSDAFAFQVVKNAGVIAANSVLATGVPYSIPTPQVVQGMENKHERADHFYRSAFSLTLKEDDTATLGVPVMQGDGSLTQFDVEATYSYSDAGHLLLSARGEQGALSLDYAFLGQGAPLKVNVLVDDGTTPHIVAAGGQFLAKEVDKWTPQTVVGIYNLGGDFFTPEQYFWVEVNADGTALTVDIYDYDKDGEIGENEIRLEPGLWQINDSGNLSIRRYRNNRTVTNSIGYCTPQSYDPALTDACVLYHEREWNLHQVVGDEYHMQHVHRYYLDMYAEDLGDAYQLGQHVLDRGLFDNRIWHKLDARPYPLPASLSVTGEAKPQPVSGPTSVFTLKELDLRQKSAEVAREARLARH